MLIFSDNNKLSKLIDNEGDLDPDLGDEYFNNGDHHAE